MEDEDKEEKLSESENRVYSTFNPMYMLYEFEDAEAEECCAVIVNLYVEKYPPR
jgi:hypothetical protein